MLAVLRKVGEFDDEVNEEGKLIDTAYSMQKVASPTTGLTPDQNEAIALSTGGGGGSYSTMGDRAFIAFGDRSTWPLPECFLCYSLCFRCYFSCLALVICCQYLVLDVIPLF
jgi:hypothetical protein